MSEGWNEQWVWFEHRWKVLKNEMHKKVFGEWIQSPEFLTIRNGLRYHWKLKLYPKGRAETRPTADKQPNMELTLRICEGGIQSAVRAKYKMQVVGREERDSGGPRKFNLQWKSNPSKGIHRGWRTDLYPHQELDKIGTPTEVEFRVRVGIREQDFDFHHLFPNPLLHNWPKGLSLYQQTVLGDQSHGQEEGAVVLVAEGERIRCLQVMLVESSPIFQTMFASENQESLTREVLIPDVSAKSLKQLLYFFYVEDLPEGWKDNVLGLLYAAHKYNVKSLELVCEKEAVGQLSLETAVQSLKATKGMGLRLLQMKATHFILDNWKELPETEKEELKMDAMMIIDVSCLDRAFEINME